MTDVNCPSCREKGYERTLIRLANGVKVAQGSVKCWVCGASFGWNLRDNKVTYIW